MHLFWLNATLAPSPPVRVRFFAGGVEEWYLVRTKGACAITVRFFRRVAHENVSATSWESAQTGSPVALIFGGDAAMNRPLGTQEALVSELHKAGIDVAVVGLCGLGHDMWQGGLWEFAPLLLGRTHVGLHAAEVLLAARWAASRGARQLFLIATGDSSAALLHAALHVREAMHVKGQGAASVRGVLAGVALVRTLCCLEDVATSLRHRLPWPMLLPHVLSHYDLPDLLAALAAYQGPSALVFEPRGPTLRPLPSGRARAAYQLASQRFKESGRRFQILAGRRRHRPGRLDMQGEAEEIASFARLAVGGQG